MPSWKEKRNHRYGHPKPYTRRTRSGKWYEPKQQETKRKNIKKWLKTQHELLYPSQPGLSTELQPASSCHKLSYKILKYSVSREDYGRLEYNAEIAHRIHSSLLDADLDVPDIVTAKRLSFLVLTPNTRRYKKLVDDKYVTDITKEFHVKEKRRNRWIVLFPESDMPIKLPKKSEKLFLGKPVENLIENPEVSRFLTFSFENEIFAYSERALQHVLDRLSKKKEQEQEMLSYTKLEIHSLLARKLPQHDTSAFSTTTKKSNYNNDLKCPDFRHISEALQHKSMQDCGIQGFCNTVDGFLVFVADRKRSADKECNADRIEKQIENCLRKWLKPKVVWVEQMATTNLSYQGCKLTNMESKSRGTLGCFGKGPGDSKVAITAGHFVKKGQNVYIDKDGIREEFGRCGQSHFSRDSDIAVINIHGNMIPGSVEFRNEKKKICEASVYQEDEIKPWPVHKIGATTQCTSGVVYCDKAVVCEDEGILINGDKNHAFAEKGDSGSVVFFYDPEDLGNTKVKLLSIVSKEISVKKKGGVIPVGLSRTPTLTRSLKDGLDKMSNIKIPYTNE